MFDAAKLTNIPVNKLFDIFKTHNDGMINLIELKAVLECLHCPVSLDDLLMLLQTNDKTYRVDYPTFKAVVESCVANTSKLDVYKRIFQLFCGTKSGFTFEMLQKLVSDLNEPISYEELVEMFNLADKNNDGVITFDEYTELLDYMNLDV